MEKLKRLFFAMEVVAPWPEQLPKGRLILESNRHLTLAFLGNAHLPTIQKHLESLPRPPFRVGLAAAFTKPLFLPLHSPRVAAWQIDWWEKEPLLIQYRQTIAQWLKTQGFLIQEEFLSHVTIARHPFVIQEWTRSFVPLPCFAKDILLYESLGHSAYKMCWKGQVLAPFDAIEHMADIAFMIRGTHLEELYVHAWLALCFFEPFLSEYFVPAKPDSLLQIVEMLNAQIAIVDGERGCPIKAVSHHGKLRQVDDIIQWEMIADV
jgi:2'-5' RNA ligase